jgi:hypothetical protein
LLNILFCVPTSRPFCIQGALARTSLLKSGSKSAFIWIMTWCCRLASVGSDILITWNLPEGSRFLTDEQIVPCDHIPENILDACEKVVNTLTVRDWSLFH